MALTTDYLVIGAGAVAMAFVDTMLDESDATFTIVDKRHAPGGHWNDAYPFVRLHQPSANYGVASTPLGGDRIDAAGPNKGFFELASGAEVLAYFEKVMRERFLPSGRVAYHPMSEVVGPGRFRSLLNDKIIDVDIRKKTVDGTFFNTSVPATHTRKYAVDEDVACIAPGGLPRSAPQYRRFTIVGAGKTAMDVGVWLVENGVDPDAVTWITPRDSWLVNRATTQCAPAFFDSFIGGAAAQFEAAAAASSVEDFFERLEAGDVMFRIDRAKTPEMFHYATISEGEVLRLRRIRNVVREGRVSCISADRMIMESGAEIPAPGDSLYIDCTARAVEFSGETRPVFEDHRITLQSLFSPLVTLSASIAGYVEANYDDNSEKNRLCPANILADTPAEFLSSFSGNVQRQFTWSQDRELNRWIRNNRLSVFGKAIDAASRNDPEKAAVLKRMQDAAMPAMINLQKLTAA